MIRRRRLKRLAERCTLPNKRGPNKISIKHPQIIAGMLAVALAFDSSGIVRIGLLCAVLHECGHIAAYRLLAGKWPSLVMAPGEVRIRIPLYCFTPGRELLVASAGVAFNALGCFCILLLMENCLGFSYRGYWFAVDNILLAGLNLIPLRALDGGRMLDCLRQIMNT